MIRASFAATLVVLLGVSSARADKIVLVAGDEKAKLTQPFAVDFDESGNLFFVEMTANRLGKLDAKGNLTILGGIGTKGDAGDDGPAEKAQFNGPHSLVVGADGSVYIADTWNNRVRKFDPKSAKLVAFAGTGEQGFAGDGGPALMAKFGGVYCLAFDPNREKMFIADLDNRRIRAIDLKSGKVATVAGNGTKGVPEDGAIATEAPLVDPRAVAVDGKGNIFVLERSGHALRVVDSAGKVRTVAGTGKPGFSGDDGDALKAMLNGPKHLDIDRDGNVLIADTENHVIRKYILATGKIVRVAGTGKKGAAGVGGPPEQVELSQPHGVCAHPNGDVYISDSSNNRILKITK